MDFSHIILEKEQKDLFIQIVETVKAIPRNKREKMLYIKSFRVNKLVISTKDHKRYDIDNIVDGDLDVLAQNGLLNVSYTKEGSKQYLISPQGFKYYDWVVKKMGKPVERIEKKTIGYLDSEKFRNKFDKAYQKLKKAEEMLWSSDEEKNFTAIGHHCREAMQEFADQLYVEVFQEKSEENKSLTVNRIRAVINKRSSSTGNTVEEFLKALLPYWGTVNDLVQRQEHGAQKEGEKINWEDSRRVVFQTANIIFELHRTLLEDYG